MHFLHKKIWRIEKTALPLHPLLRRKGFGRRCKGSMVVLAQLAEHRIVVPSVVGSSPTFHP